MLRLATTEQYAVTEGNLWTSDTRELVQSRNNMCLWVTGEKDIGSPQVDDGRWRLCSTIVSKCNSVTRERAMTEASVRNRKDFGFSCWTYEVYRQEASKHEEQHNVW